MMKTNIVTGLKGVDLNTGLSTDLGEVETTSVFMGAAIKLDFEDALVSTDEESKGIQEYQYLKGVEGWHVSGGLILGTVSPHITYAKNTFTASDENPFSNDELYLETQSITEGARWDFHPNAAFKIELTERRDVSDKLPQLILGKSREVTAVSAGVDLVF